VKKLGIRCDVFALVVFVALIASGCGFDTSRIMSPEGCANKEKVDAELHVDPGDDRWIWAVDRQSGAAISLRLADAYGVATDPPAIVDQTGQPIGRTGDLVISGCRDLIQNALMIDQSDIEAVTNSSS
jgi:hypothetical protein